MKRPQEKQRTAAGLQRASRSLDQRGSDGGREPAPSEVHVPCNPSRTRGLRGALNTSLLSRPMSLLELQLVVSETQV